MLDTGQKAEIQALASKDWRYMTNTYLPNKIDSGDWV
jgi:DNA topoisomerase VI subunit A